MKKLIKYLLVLVLCIPFIVFADGGSPTFAPYDVYVSDKDGASLYDYDYKNEVYMKTKYFLEYNHQLKIEDEEEVSDGLIYGYVEYNEEYFYINLSKVTPLKEEYTVEDLKKEFEIDPRETSEDTRDEMFETNKVLIMTDNVTLRKGPNNKYGVKEEKLNKEDILTKKAEVGDWMFVENDTASGWINTEKNIVMELNEDTIWLLEDTPAYDDVIVSKAKLLDNKLPKNEKFNSAYYYEYDEEVGDEDFYYEVYRVEYEGNIYYINVESIKYAVTDNDQIITYKEANCYDDVDGNVVKTVKKNTKAKETYSSINANEHWVYVEFDDGSYWLHDKDVGVYYESPVKLVDDVEIDNVTIPANTEFETYYYNSADTAYYVDYKGKNYWFADEDYVADYIDEDYSEYTTSSETYLYDKPNGERSETTIPAETELKITYEFYEYEENENISWYYINTKNYKGWITDKENDMTEFQEVLAQREENATYVDKKPAEVVEPNVVVPSKKLSKKELIIICSLSAVILALVIYVIILLVNKKKQVKLEPVQEQPAKETVQEAVVQTEPTEENKDA